MASPLAAYPVRATRYDERDFAIKFDSNNTSHPDGVVPDYTGVTVARTGTGTITITFAASVRPLEFRQPLAYIVGDESNLFAKVVSYVASTGVLTVKMYTNNAGTIAAADSTDKEVWVSGKLAYKAYS
jgi:hypothetical protein